MITRLTQISIVLLAMRASHAALRAVRMAINVLANPVFTMNFDDDQSSVVPVSAYRKRPGIGLIFSPRTSSQKRTRGILR